jgi:UDPglucose 6-dehydrogenase
MHFAKPLLPAAVHYASSALDALAGAEALVLITEWNEFRNIAPEKMAAVMKGRVILDLRNVYDPGAMREAGFTYHSIGRP